MTQAELEMIENSNVKIVRHVPVKRLKSIVQGYRSAGATTVSSKPEQGQVNEYIVTAQFS
jgi:hypothetical protein